MDTEPRTLTFDESQQLLTIFETPADRRTPQQAAIWQAYQERNQWERQRLAEARQHRRQQEEQGRRAEAEYARQLMAADTVQQDPVQHFMQQLAQRSRPVPRLTIGESPEAVARYLEAAYQAEVRRTGGTATLDAMTRRAISDAARWLTQGRKPGLILRGSVGTGKTTLLAAIRLTLSILKGEHLQVWEARRIAPLAKGAEGQKVLDDLAKRPLLGIDDLGVESVQVKDYGNETTPVVDLLSERYNRRAFTIITTNLSAEEIVQRYGDRLADRLRELCNTITYDGNQASYRK